MWTTERVVVFTEYAHTVDWIQRVLAQQGYTEVLAVIQGSTPPIDRELIRSQFVADPTAPNAQVRVLLATDAAGEGIDLQTYCYRLVNFDIPFNPSRLEQRIGRIDRYGQRLAPEVFHFIPESDTSIYAGDYSFMARIAKKVSIVETDLGSVNQVIGDEIQTHFGRRKPQRRKAAGIDPNEVINASLANGQELNAQLTKLEQGFDASRTEKHLDPENLRRVVDTALRITHQPPLVPLYESGEGVFDLPPLTAGWQSVLTGLDTRLAPGDIRPITFDSELAKSGDDTVYVHLGHPILQRAQRLLRRSLWSVDTSLNRVTAVIVPELSESFVGAVTRMVLVGRGGLRLHEEVFLAGVRLQGRRAMAEEKAEAALDLALDANNLILADHLVRLQVSEMWNATDAPLPARLTESIEARAAKRKEAVSAQLIERRDADVRRAQQIFAAFRTNLTESLQALNMDEAKVAAMLFPDDQQRQRRRDMESMAARLEELTDEEHREVSAINERYSNIKHHTTTAAVVFALTSADAEGLVN